MASGRTGAKLGESKISVYKFKSQNVETLCEKSCNPKCGNMFIDVVQ